MIQYLTERSNKRDHWSSGLYYPDMSDVCERSISLPPGSVRNCPNHRQVGDPPFSFIL
jgi:hypothetical protein